MHSHKVALTHNIQRGMKEKGHGVTIFRLNLMHLQSRHNCGGRDEEGNIDGVTEIPTETLLMNAVGSFQTKSGLL